MNIIICGAGKVGFSISKQLSAQGHSITVIDQSSEDIKRINDHQDAKGIVGRATIFLETSLEEIHYRIGLNPRRPLYNDEFSLKKIYDERIPIYKKAHYTVKTDGKSVSELVNEIKLFIQ